MTGATAVAVHPRVDDVHGEVVVGVEAPIADATIMAGRALALGVADGAAAPVLRGARAVRKPEVGVMVEAAHPARRVHPAVREMGAQPAVELREMADRAAIWRAAGAVTGDAAGHRGELESGREADPANAFVAALTGNALGRVASVREAQVGRRNLRASDPQRRLRAPAIVAEVTTAERVGGG